MDKINNIKGFFTLLGLILAIAIILVLAQNALKTYYGKPVLDKTTQESIAGSGIDTTTYHNVVGSTRQKVKDIEKQMQDQADQLQAIK